MALDTLKLRNIQQQVKKTLGKRALDVQIQNNDIRVVVTETNTDYRKKLLIEIAKTLKVPYTSSGDRSGAISIQGSKILVKPGTVSAAGVAKTPPMLKPSNIKPSIVGIWLDAATMSRNVQKYISEQKNFDVDEKKSIINLIKIISANEATSFPLPNFPRKLVPSEFFEVLSAIKLAKLMSLNDKKIRKVLGIPSKLDLSKVKIKINIPTQANLPLLDYWININNVADESTSIKISVKSKVSNASTNTIKFQDAFKGSSPASWYADLPSNVKPNQVAQRIISQAVLDAYKLSGTPTRNSQILPLLKLLQSAVKSELASILKSYKVNDTAVLVKLLETLLKQTSKVGSTKLSEMLKGAELKLAQSMTAALETTTPDTFAAVLYVFDSIVQQSSRSSSNTKYNFYQLFYDEVLKRNKIGYAISSYKKGVLYFDYYTNINWDKEYSTYVALRIQSSTKGINSAIGLDV